MKKTTLIKHSIKHFFKVVNPNEPPGQRISQQRGRLAVGGTTVFAPKPPSVPLCSKEQSEVIHLSSDEEDDAEHPPQNSGLITFRPTAKNVTIDSDDSDSETQSGVTACVTKSAENAAEKRQLDENEENLPDSQEVQPKKKRRSNNRIGDSDEDDEGNDTGTPDDSSENEAHETESSRQQSQNTDEWRPGMESSQYSSDITDTDDECEIGSDELDYVDSYEEPDPRHLYENTGRRKKTAKRKQASYDDNQEVSIHRINLNHREFTQKPVKRVIKFIVDKYNKSKDSSSSAETKSIFEEKSVQREPAVKDEDEKHFKGDPFRVKVYVQKVGRKIALLQSYGIKERATTIHSLIFHYREGELFAITTNQAWNVVQWCSDFEFPGIIAARILSTGGELESTNKGLVGTELIRKTTHKQQKKTNPHDLLTLCTRFTAELRDNASILRLSCFAKTNPIPENDDEHHSEDGEEEEAEKEEGTQATKPLSTVKGAKVTVSLGNIRILKRLSTSDILSILSILSEISNGKDTFNLDGDIEQDSTAHKKYLTAVHFEQSNELNLRLSKIIHDAIADDNRMVELDNYQLCHKHWSDFFSGHDFKLQYRGDEVKEFDEVPTLKQILVELRPKLGQVAAGTTEKAYLQHLNNVKLSYRFGTSHNEKKAEKLLNFIDGLYCHTTENSVYWHVMGMWCHVQDGYLNLVHNRFKKYLNDYLLTDKGDPAWLRTPWSNNECMSPETKLKNYLGKFSECVDAWTSERPERDIVDMIRVGTGSGGKNALFVYYFLPDLNNQTNMKCNRVAESIMQIGKANMTRQNQNADVAGSEDVKIQLSEVYQKLVQKRRFKQACPNSKQFLQMMADAKFYLAIGRDMSTTVASIPSLENEKEMGEEIAISDIATVLESIIDAKRDNDMEMLKRTAAVLGEHFDKCGGQRLAELIHHRLVEYEYLEEDGNAIRGKLLSIGRNNFNITGNGRVNQFLYDKIISQFQPRACTVLSKMGFSDFLREISNLTITSFNLIEMPLQQ